MYLPVAHTIAVPLWYVNITNTKKRRACIAFAGCMLLILSQNIFTTHLHVTNGVCCARLYPLFPNKKCDFLSVKFGIVYENSFTSFDLCGKIAFYQSARSPLYPKQIT